jgi:hypothetical protein
MVCIRFILITLFLLAATVPAFACGWWGDGEVDGDDDAIEVDAQGRPLDQSLNFRSMKLPGKMGYGVAVPEPGRVIPYLNATFGQPLIDIKELKIFGFRSVIDLGTPPSTARLHQAETESVGMKYFSIPVKDDRPSQEHRETFNDVVLNVNNGPLLIFAEKPSMIAIMWASYRVGHGSPIEFAIHEGRKLGLTEKQEVLIQNLVRQTH